MTTQHTCGGPTFGRLAPSGQCPRCDELRGGAEPVKWAPSRKQRAAKEDSERAADIRAHFASAEHRSGKCGRVCTFGDW